MWRWQCQVFFAQLFYRVSRFLFLTLTHHCAHHMSPSKPSSRRNCPKKKSTNGHPGVPVGGISVPANSRSLPSSVRYLKAFVSCGQKLASEDAPMYFSQLNQLIDRTLPVFDDCLNPLQNPQQNPPQNLPNDSPNHMPNPPNQPPNHPVQDIRAPRGSSFSSDSGRNAGRGQCDHGRPSHGILHSSPPADLNLLQENINPVAPGLLGSGQSSSSSGSDEDRSSSIVLENDSFESPSPSHGHPHNEPPNQSLNQPTNQLPNQPQNHTTNQPQIQPRHKRSNQPLNDMPNQPHSKPFRDLHAPHLPNQSVDDSPPLNPNRKKIRLNLTTNKKRYPLSSSSSSEEASEYNPDEDSCDSSIGDVVVPTRKQRPSRKSLDVPNESKDDDVCWIDSSDNQSVDIHRPENWQLFDSEHMCDDAVFSDGDSALPCGNDEDEDTSLGQDKFSFPSQKGNTPQKGPIVSPEGE